MNKNKEILKKFKEVQKELINDKDFLKKYCTVEDVLKIIFLFKIIEQVIEKGD